MTSAGSSGRALALAAALLLPMAVAACQDTKAEAPPRVERPVLVTRAAYEPFTPSRTFVATIRPRTESELGFRVSGKVASRLVSVGDRVKVGQLLATLDETDLRLQREQAEAEKAAATASLNQAQAELKRLTTLRGEGWSTASAFDRQQVATEEARGRLSRAEKALSLAENALSYATLAADAGGIITATMVEPGQVVTAGQSAIRAARTGEKEAVVAVPEVLISQVRAGSASVTLWADPGRHYAAVLRELSLSADPASRTYQARYTIENAGDDVQLGMTATVTIVDPADRRIARLPLSALYNDGSGPAVWVINVDDRPVLKPVTVFSYQARDALISEGLREGDRVVTLGVQKLDEGQRVRIVQALQF